MVLFTAGTFEKLKKSGNYSLAFAFGELTLSQEFYVPPGTRNIFHCHGY